jgi:hypothetical protein
MAWFAAEYLFLDMDAERTIKKDRGEKMEHPTRPPDYRADSWALRIWLAWQVFRGKMDAVKWYKQ